MKKKQLVVVGCKGRMGQLVCEAIAKSEDFEVIAGYDVGYKGGTYSFPTFSSISSLENWGAVPSIDAFIDFSRPEATMKILDFAAQHRIPCLIATTGFSDEEEAIIRNASKYIPIFKSDNMSYGIYVARQLVKLMAKLIPYCDDFSIDESHQSTKKDAPSGTAKNLFFNDINEAYGNKLVPNYGGTEQKQPNEVWMSSRRVKDADGEHTITFGLPGESISVHTITYNSSVYAEGALEAARYLLEFCGCAGYYTMDDMSEDMQDN